MYTQSFVSCCLCLFFALGPGHISTEEICGKVISIKDGDTIELLDRGQPLKIRFYGIDCPEKKQAFGTKAQKYTANKCFGKDVIVRTHGKDRYRRTLGEVILPNGQNLNYLLVMQGLAWRYKYSKDKILGQLEQQARVKKVGLWAVPDAKPPWVFRAEAKSKSTTQKVGK